MKLFHKKQKPSVLNRGRLAEAVSIAFNKIDLEEMRYTKKRLDCFHLLGTKNDENMISLNDHLKIEINNAYYTYDASLFCNSFIVLDYYCLNISTYVDDIKMANYRFELDIHHNENLYREWECKESNIVHAMPNQFIDLMNEWSENITSKMHEQIQEENNKKQLDKQKRYDDEEEILEKYR